MPVQALWGIQGFVARQYNVIKEWQEVANTVTGHPVSGGHFLPEEATKEPLNHSYLLGTSIMSSYHLAAPLANGTVFVTSFEGCDLRLVDDARYLWLLLIPQKGGIEWHDLNAHERHQLIDTASAVADIIQTTKAKLIK